MPNDSSLTDVAAPVKSILHSPPVPTVTSEFLPIVTLPPTSSSGAVTESAVAPSAFEIESAPTLSDGAEETDMTTCPVLSITPGVSVVGTPPDQLPGVLKSSFAAAPVQEVSAVRAKLAPTAIAADRNIRMFIVLDPFVASMCRIGQLSCK